MFHDYSYIDMASMMNPLPGIWLLIAVPTVVTIAICANRKKIYQSASPKSKKKTPAARKKIASTTKKTAPKSKKTVKKVTKKPKISKISKSGKTRSQRG